MTFVMKTRGAPVSKTRTLECDCGFRWKQIVWDAEEAIPDCPACDVADQIKEIPGGFNITGVKAKAVDFAYKMAEEDYGMTNMNDRLREGDIAFKGPSAVQSAEAEALTRQMQGAMPEGLNPTQAAMVNNFWKGGMGAGGILPQRETQVLTATARANAVAANASGSDPIAMLHSGAKREGGMKLQVVNRPKRK